MLEGSIRTVAAHSGCNDKGASQRSLRNIRLHRPTDHPTSLRGQTLTPIGRHESPEGLSLRYQSSLVAPIKIHSND